MQLIFVDGRRAQTTAEQAVAVARNVGDRRLILDVMCTSSLFLWEVDGLERSKEVLQLAREVDDRALTALAAQRSHADAIVWGDRQEAEDALTLFENTASQTGRPDLRWMQAYETADWVCLQGRLDDAERLSEEAWALGRRTGQPGALLVHASQIMTIRWHQGRPADAAPLLTEAAAAHQDFSLLRLPIGPDATPAELAQAVRDLPVDGAWLGAIGILGEQVSHSGHLHLIASVYTQLEPYRHLFNKQGPLTRGPVAHTLALLAAASGRLEDAGRHFAAADELNRRLGFPFYTARTAVDWARFLTQHSSGQRQPNPQASELLEDALETATRHDYKAVERRARRALSQLQEPSR